MQIFKIKKIIILSFIFIWLLTSGFGCKLIDKETKEAMEKITLTYWRVWDGSDAFKEIIANYNQLHPFITIEYRKLRYSEYEQELLEAMAEDRAPDIFSIHNTWINKYQNKLAPLPAEITMAYPVVKGTIKKEIITELRTAKSINLKELKNDYVDAVYRDIVVNIRDEEGNQSEEKIVALPLSVDTLAMYYNRDLLNNASIAEPPQYWNREFQQNVKTLTKQNTQGKLIQSGVGLGGSKNIERHSDILSILMMQNGSIMEDENNRIMFDKVPPLLQKQKYNPGIEALRFYTDFSNPAKEVYCWDDSLNNSLDLFIQGKLGLMFGYAYHLPTIKARAPKLNFSIAKLPQIENNQKNINFANYWVETVSNKSKYIDEAWSFIQFMTSAEQVKSYLNITKKPTALRSLINGQIDDMEIGIFAEQLLTAQNWYKGDDANAMELIIGEMIDEVNQGGEKIEEIIRRGAERTQQTIKKN